MSSILGRCPFCSDEGPVGGLCVVCQGGTHLYLLPPPAESIPAAVDHPPHYGGADDPYEAIKVIEAWRLGFCLGNAVKYICRAGRKGSDSLLQDLEKARWYLDREISRLRSGVV
jgi:hypothetical protein